jgi:dynein heavy chain
MTTTLAHISSEATLESKAGSDEALISTGERLALQQAAKSNTFIGSLDLSAQQLHDLFKVAHTFFYLRCRERGKMGQDVGSVYDLELVALDQVDKNFYFTLSKEGVTQFRNKVSSFTSLAQWEREYSLFHKIARINFFRVYKRWKVFSSQLFDTVLVSVLIVNRFHTFQIFTVWRKGLRYNKMALAASFIETNLFLFSTPLRKALLQVRTMTIPLSNMGMLSLPQGVTFDLDDFVRVQGVVHEELRGNLRSLSANVLTTVRSACDEVVDQFLKANNIAANHKMTFMERAALRAECKKLTRFLRMMDILIADFLKTMVNDAMSKLVTAVESENLTPHTETADDATREQLARKREQAGLKTPIFRVVASFKKMTQREQTMQDLLAAQNAPPASSPVSEGAPASPAAPLIPDDEALVVTPSVENMVRALDGVVKDAMEIVGSFVKVLTSVETEMYVMPEGDEEDGDATEPEDMIATIKNSPKFNTAKDSIHAHLRQAFGAVKDYLNVFQPYRQIYLRNAQHVSNIAALFESGDVEAFQNAIAEYRAQIDQFKGVPRFSDVGVLFVDSVNVKAGMNPSPVQCLAAIQKYLPELALMRAQELVDQVGAMNPIISGDPNSVENYVNKKKVKDTAALGLESYNARQSYIRSLVHIMDDNSWPAPDQVKALMRMLKESLVSLTPFRCCGHCAL